MNESTLHMQYNFSEYEEDSAAETSNFDNLSTSSIQSPNDLMEMNHRYAISTSQKAAEQKKVLSNTLLENAKLKKSIAIAEAENAQLEIDLRNIKSQLATVESLSNSRSCSISDLEAQLSEKSAQLESANEIIDSLRKELELTRSARNESMNEIDDKLKRHRDELKRATSEIERLSKTNFESDELIKEFEKSLRVREDKISDYDTSEVDVMELREENMKLKQENAQLKREKEAIRGYVQRTADDYLRMMYFFTSRVADDFTRLERQLQNCSDDLGSMLNTPSRTVLCNSSNSLLMKMEERIRSIARLNTEYAGSHHKSSTSNESE